MPDYIPPDNVVIQYKTGGIFNDDMICDYLEEIMSDKPGGTTLILDSARCHLTSKVSDKFEALGLKKVFVMPRMTNLLQPADVGWFSIIKKHLHQRWNNWYLSEEHTFTRFGNIRSPGYALCIKWLSEIWINFPEAYIINSFQQCGISSTREFHSALQKILNDRSPINSFVDFYHESDDLDGFTDVDLFEAGQSEVDTPLVNNREILE